MGESAMLPSSSDPRILALAEEFTGLPVSEPFRPTLKDRARLLDVRDRIMELMRADDLNPLDERDLQCLYTKTTKAANLQEDFFAANDNTWAA